jgi:Hint domain
MHAPTPKSPPDDRRTRRNVIAMMGILASTVVAATIGATKTARAGGVSYAPSGGTRTTHTGTTTVASTGASAGATDGCFLAGTKILTDSGETAVENLRAGDRVRTVSGQWRAIKRVIDWSAQRAPNRDWTDDVAPIKICRSALAPNVPQRDLYLSPSHALYLDGVLVCVGGLVNNCSIVRCSKGDADRLSYFHLELEDHQVIFAEGALVETSLGAGMAPFAPIWFGGRKSKFASRLRSAISPWVDRRNVADKVRDHLDVRGESGLAA